MDQFLELEDAAARNDFQKMDLLFSHTTNDLWHQISHIAAERGNLAVMKYLVKRCPLVLKMKSKNGETVAHIAAKFGRTDIIKYVMQKHPPIIRKKNKKGETIIHISARFGHLEIVQYVMKLQPRDALLPKNVDGLTPVHIAARNGHLSIVQYFMDGGYANREIIKDLFDIVIQNGHLNILKYFVKHYYTYYVYGSSFLPLAKTAVESGRLVNFFYIAEKCKLLKEESTREVFKKNITDTTVLESIYQAFSHFESTEEAYHLTQIAAEVRNVNIIRYLAEKAPFYFTKSHYKYHYKPFLIRASEAGVLDLTTLRILSEKGITIWNITDSRQNTVLHSSAKVGDLNVIQWLGQREPDMLQMKNKDGDTVPHIAVHQGHKEILICIAGICPKSLGISGGGGRTALQVAVEKDIVDLETLKFLVEEKGVPLNGTDKNGDTFAHTAIRLGNKTLLQYVLQLEPSLAKPATEDDNTVHGAERKSIAHLALETGNADMVQYLLNKTPLLFNSTELDLAVEKNFVNLQQMKVLIKEGVLPRKSLAIIVSKKGDLDFIRYLVENIPSTFSNEDVLTECARSAAISNHIKVVRYLVERNPDIFVQKLRILSCFPDENDISETIECLAEACIRKISHWDRRKFECQVTHCMVKEGHREVLKYFLEQKKWDVNILNEEGEPPIFTAVRNRMHEIFRYLASERNANLTILNPENENILFLAAKKCDLYPIKFVLDEMKTPIDLEWRNNEGVTLLHVTFEKVLEDNDFSVLNYLVERKKFLINSRRPDGNTTLHIAARLSKYHLCDYLLDHGADPKLKDSESSDFYRLLHFPSPPPGQIGNEEDADDEIRKRRSVDSSVASSTSTMPYLQIDNFSIELTNCIMGGSDNINPSNTPTLQSNLLGFLAMTKYFNRKNMIGNFRELIALQSPVATLTQRMDIRAVSAVHTVP